MEITAKLVKDLRDKTGAGMMDCKKALSESNGDLDKAVAVLRERGIAKAGSKEGRVTSEGVIACYIPPGEKLGAMIEINCETDFVARTDQFKTFCMNIAKHVAANPSLGSAGSGDLLLPQPFSAKPSMTVGDAITETIAGLGENTILKRFARFETTSGVVSYYVHPGDKLGVLVEISAKSSPKVDELKTFARDVAMHVAAASPAAVRREQVDSTAIDAEKSIFRKQAENEKKPAAIIDKIVDGKVEKYYAEVVLMEQSYVKDNDKTVGDLVKEMSSLQGEPVAISRFVRFRLGE